MSIDPNKTIRFEHIVPGVKLEDIENVSLTPCMFINPLNDSDPTKSWKGIMFDVHVEFKTEEAVIRWKEEKERIDKL